VDVEEAVEESVVCCVVSIGGLQDASLTQVDGRSVQWKTGHKES
jgi:hypothetical protein